MRTSMFAILCIGIRLAAVLLAVNTLLSIPAGYSALMRGGWSASELRWLALIWAIVLLFALWLWVYPGVLGRLAAGKSSQQVFESPISADQLQYIAFSVVGLWMLLAGLVDVAQLAVRELLIDHVLSNRSGPIAADARTALLMDFIEQFLRIVLGIALMLRASGLVALLRRTRYAGLPADAMDTTPSKEQA